MRTNIYTYKHRWKWFLAVCALAIFSLTTWYTTRLANSFSIQERQNARIWAETIHKKADLVNYTETYFEEIRQEERRRVELLASTYRNLLSAKDGDNLAFYLNIISNNKTIPVILTDKNREIQECNALVQKVDSITHLDGEILKEYSKYPPIRVNYIDNEYNLLFYRDSRLSEELKKVLSELTNSFFDEVAYNSASMPVIITNAQRDTIYATGNLNELLTKKGATVEGILEDMAVENEPIITQISGQSTSYIYYFQSDLVNEIKLYPIVQFGILALLLLTGYGLFSLVRNTEQNQVWVGMSKETAHQLGTPISSLMAWVELMKMTEGQETMAVEIAKDVNRLHTVSDRFSKIGSIPKMELTNVVEVIQETVQYLESRSSKKVKFYVNVSAKELAIPLSRELFAWVIENLSKNAVDAMEGVGEIIIVVEEDNKHIHIDFSDTGKGIARRNFTTLFKPGYTSKKRGWGLGLSLVKRIISQYHHGKVFVKSSVVGEGTTFHIQLNKQTTKSRFSFLKDSAK